ncbi:hypothetical protein [Pseudomonas japonica]|uniref:hypothetical protein n=1 Tax=Pseudomonas japonica TaxID=256466 RepID=UPI0015E39D2C|nr:hypothetical protein [Pseudomonas japonica]MBA1245261.1 hypothetical protein [Pseudomonas japonica]
MMEGPCYEIEHASFELFLNLWYSGTFAEQRLGQAFYNHFKLHQLTNQNGLHELYESSGKKALRMIGDYFLIR